MKTTISAVVETNGDDGEEWRHYFCRFFSCFLLDLWALYRLILCRYMLGASRSCQLWNVRAPLAYRSLIWELEAPAVWSRPMALIWDVCFSVCQFNCPCQKLSEYIFLLTILKMCCEINVLWYYGHMVFDRICMIGLYQKCKTDTIWKMYCENNMVLWLRCFNQPFFPACVDE